MSERARIAGRAGFRRSDAVLAEAARAGDDRAFAALYERHAPAIFDFLARMVRDIPAAEDLLQRVFLRALEHRQDLRDPARVRSWLFSLAYWLAVNDLSRTRATEPVEQRELASPEPEALVADQETAALVWAAAAALERRQYAVLDLLVRRGLSIPEIAQALGVAPGHATVLVHRAKRALDSAVRALLITRNRSGCERLAALVPAGAQTFTLAQRASVDHHLCRCRRCKQLAFKVVDEALLAGLPPVALPAHFVHAGWAPALGQTSRTGPPAPTGRGGHETVAAAHHEHPATKLLRRRQAWTSARHALAARTAAAMLALGAGAAVALGLTSGGSAPANRATPLAATATTPATTPAQTHKVTKPKARRRKRLLATQPPSIAPPITTHPTPSPRPKTTKPKRPKTTPRTPRSTTTTTKATKPKRPKTTPTTPKSTTTTTTTTTKPTTTTATTTTPTATTTTPTGTTTTPTGTTTTPPTTT